MDRHLNNFLIKTYGWVAGGLTLTFSLAYLLSELSLVINYGYPILIIGFLLTIAGIIGIHILSCEYRTIGYGVNKHVVSDNPPSRIMAYGTFLVGNSLFLSPIFAMVNQIDSCLIPVSLIITVGLFGLGLSFIKFRSQSQISNWEIPLMTGLSGLIWLGILSTGLHWVSPVLADSLHWVESLGGLVIFVCMVTYDFHRIAKMYQQGETDHLLCSISSYLDFLNLLLRVIEILLKIKSRENKSDNKSLSQRK